MVILRCKVIPRSRVQKWGIQADGTLKCYLKNSPEHGKANRELVELLSSILEVPQKAIAIITGQTGRMKKVAIETDRCAQDIQEQLGLNIQMKLF